MAAVHLGHRHYGRVVVLPRAVRRAVPHAAAYAVAVAVDAHGVRGVVLPQVRLADVRINIYSGALRLGEGYGAVRVVVSVCGVVDEVVLLGAALGRAGSRRGVPVDPDVLRQVLLCARTAPRHHVVHVVAGVGSLVPVQVLRHVLVHAVMAGLAGHLAARHVRRAGERARRVGRLRGGVPVQAAPAVRVAVVIAGYQSGLVVVGVGRGGAGRLVVRLARSVMAAQAEGREIVGLNLPKVRGKEPDLRIGMAGDAAAAGALFLIVAVGTAVLAVIGMRGIKSQGRNSQKNGGQQESRCKA